MKSINLIMALFCIAIVSGQNPNEDKIKTTNFPKLKKLVSTDIPGAISFSQPQLITGTKQEIRIEKHGLIYPAFFDWNKDGKKDLLLGEFETGKTGSNIKVYINKGSKKKPKFSGEYFYATDVKGDTITNYQWCCIGIHPRVVDLDQDGYDDILSGQYNPGAISWWRGSKDGFLPRKIVPQEGYNTAGPSDTHRTKLGSAPWQPEHLSYWNYTTSDFGDFNGDGLLDLFVGGSGDMRVALNIGTKENPKFGLRNYLYHVDGSILYVKKPKQKEIDASRKQLRYPLMSGVGKSYIKPVDWDKDGVLDLLVTYEYKKKGHNPIDFYRGVNTDKGLRFEKRVPVITAKDGSKALPGVQPMITLTDYNNDGVQDIVLGLSVPTINGFEAANEVAWAWAADLKIEMPGKDAGRQLQYFKGGLEEIIKRFEDPEQGKFFKQMMLGNLEDHKYLTMRHRGYVFVMYGKKATTKATPKMGVEAAPAYERKLIPNEVVKKGNLEGPVNYSAKVPERTNHREMFTAEVTITFDKGWHGYVDNKANRKDGFIPTTVAFEYPDFIEPVEDVVAPKESYKGLSKVYKGDVTFRQKFKFKKITSRKELYDLPKSYEVKAHIKFQTCDANICLPPKEITENLNATVKLQ
ncbi:protein-disulfide reductase DsbD domain-containing protein [Flagellimonas onchidii]|uniref:protein-disulfide reductase DsbD domain-containing protein n=1 Tax=Flagellimonas onchidii TaxID=2562684 RepID=UPI0010A6A715|nr:protein-disulfide reductase DsbD domain-containing protein [Allomuricauda onchidii]